MFVTSQGHTLRIQRGGEVIENIEKAQYKKEKEMYSYIKEKNQK